MATPTASLRDRSGRWLLLATIGNLRLTQDVQGEIRLDRVTFLTASRFQRIHKRLGINRSELRKSLHLERLVKGDQPLAMICHTGDDKNCLDLLLRQIREEIDVLSFSQLLYCRRNQMAPLGLAGEAERGVNSHILLNLKAHTFTATQSKVGKANELTLDRHWKAFHKPLSFLRLVKIAQRRLPVKEDWRRELLRAAQLIGKGINSYDLSSAFVWNMVALEVLLTRTNERQSETLPERAEALLGWISDWKTDGMTQRLKAAYQLRCRIVHDGLLNEVTASDVGFTDHILFNVLNNLVRHPRLFASKEHVIRFAELIAAEKLLGRKRTVRPKTLMYVKRRPA